ncbi:MAG TPA: FimV/HubP family polar landmark protein, partial [Nitrococcus sp.]|nr:FimV/HubP family polar landmark protein [Nitrococcus sp.]
SIADQVLAPTRQNILRLQQQLAAVEERNANLQSANGQLQQQASLLKKELINLKSLVSLQLPKGIRLPVAGPAADRSSVSAMAPQGTAASLQAKVTSENPTGEIPPLAPLSRETAEGGHVVTQGEVKNTAAAVDSAHSGPITVENSVAGSGAVTGASGSGRPQPIAAASPPATKAQPKPARHQAQPAAVKPQANPAAQQPVSLKTRLLGYLSQWLAPLVAGVLLALALLLWVVRRRRGAAMPLRRRSAQAGAPDMGQALATAKLDKATPSLDSANTLQAVTAVAESTPLEEAETCIAYGHYAQAQELLDRALGEQPDSQELRLKLLEVLAAQGDRSGFEAEAQVLHTQVADESDPCWRRAVQLARDIAPDHPLFSSALAVAAETTPARREKSMSTAVTADKLTARSMPQAVTAGGDLGSEEQALDLTVSLDKEELRSGNGREQSTVLEFDLGEIGEFISQQAKENMAPGIAQGGAAEEDDDLESLDFSVPEDWTAPTETKKGNGDGRDRHALQLGELSMQEDNAIFDAERASIAEPDDPMSLDEAGTKLDLARAYLDMGDAAGARSLLNEVVMEGNAAQQSEAQDLLRQTP